MNAAHLVQDGHQEAVLLKMKIVLGMRLGDESKSVLRREGWTACLNYTNVRHSTRGMRDDSRIGVYNSWFLVRGPHQRHLCLEAVKHESIVRCEME